MHINLRISRTNVNGASASLLFNGSAITVYGATSTDYGLFSVSLDGNAPLLLNGSAPMFRPQNMLYYAGGLSDEVHSLTFTNADPNGSWFDLDKFVVSTWQTLDDIAISSSSSSTSHLPGPSLLNPNQSPQPK
ncbi:hypothetical protein PHLCEN_2v1812 [Hermanssonia centrifuga]|uniref:Uncharacterized protein n=1 Tax=Hermanssonia centrifuga TaxID=98765 RepID=A0A2R6RVU0_9APHY|nr:hypothetical protein PHLCEN_2v1812 [Hermanssonia centrifuga]